MDGTGDTMIVDEDVKSFSISDNKLFYISYGNSKISTANLDGTGKMEVTSDAAGTLNVHNGWIYYSMRFVMRFLLFNSKMEPLTLGLGCFPNCVFRRPLIGVKRLP